MELLKYLTGELRLSMARAWNDDYGFDEDELLDIFDKLGKVNNKQELLRALFSINENNTGKLCYQCKFYVYSSDSPYCKKWRMLVFSAAGNPMPITDTCYKTKDT